MSTENTFKDPRLLEALEYLDNKFIAEVFDDLKVPDMSDYVPGKKKPFALWKQIAALAACLILLMFATPLFSKVADVISSFAASWGGVSTTNTDFESKELYELYPNYSPTPLSEERIAELEKVWVNLNSCFIENGGWMIYLGEFNGCVCFLDYGQLAAVETENIAGYEFRDNCFTLHAIYNGELLYLSQAYELGYVTEEEMGMMAAYHARIMQGIVILTPPETTTPLYKLFPDYIPEPLDEAKKKEIETLMGGNTNWFHEDKTILGIWYLGTFNEHVILVRFDEYKKLQDREIAGYAFSVSKGAELVAYVNNEIIDLETAYERGLFTDEEIGKAASLQKKLIMGFDYPIQ